MHVCKLQSGYLAVVFFYVIAVKYIYCACHMPCGLRQGSLAHKIKIFHRFGLDNAKISLALRKTSSLT